MTPLDSNSSNNTWKAVDGRVVNLDGALKEYDARLAEIRSIESNIHQFLGIMYAAIGVITAASLSIGNSYLILVSFALLIIGNLYVTEKRWVIWLNAAYVKRYLENENTGVWWEHRLWDLRSKVRSPVGGIKRVDFWIFNITGLILATLFVLIEPSGPMNAFAAVRYILPVLMIIFLWWLTTRNFNRLRTGDTEIALFDALPAEKS